MNSYYNYSTVTEYQAQSSLLMKDLTLNLDSDYGIISLLLLILPAIIAFALALFTALSIKRARPLGIIVALAQPIGLFASLQSVLAYSKIDYSSLEMTVTSKVSMENAMTKLYEKMADTFLAEVFPQLVGYVFWTGVLLVVTILTLVYAIMLIKANGKAMAIMAMILVILRHLLIAPIEMISVLMGESSMEIQLVWDVFFRFAFMLPIFLLAIQGIINLVCMAKNRAKAKKQAAAEKLKEQA